MDDVDESFRAAYDLFRHPPPQLQGPYRAFRLDWVGRLQPSAYGLLIEVVLCPFTVALTTCASPRAITGYARMSRLKRSALGDIVDADEHVRIPKGSYDRPEVHIRAQFSLPQDAPYIIHVDEIDPATGCSFLPAHIYSPFRPHRSFFCVIELSDGTRLLVPCWAVLNESYAASIPVLNGLLTGSYVGTSILKEVDTLTFDGYSFISKRRLGHETRCSRETIDYAERQANEIVRRAILRNQLEGFYSIEAIPPFFGQVHLSGSGFAFDANGRRNYLLTSVFFSSPIDSDVWQFMSRYDIYDLERPVYFQQQIHLGEHTETFEAYLR